MSNTNSVAKAPIFNASDVGSQAQGFVTASLAWVQAYWLQILIAFGAGALIVLALHTARRFGSRLCERPRALNGWGIVVGKAVSRTSNFFIVMLAAKLVDGYSAAPGEVATTVNFLFTVAAVFQVAVWVREIILGAIEHRTQSEHYSGEALLSAMGLIRLLVTFVVFAVAMVVVLDNLGVNVTGLVAGLGVGGIAIGLAIIFDRPFRRGDSISYDTASGSVEAIGLKSTRIRGIDGEERVISNKNLLNKEILNNTQRNHRRAKFIIGVTYFTPAEICARIPDMLKDVVEAQGKIFVRAGFTGFGASSLDFEVQFDSDGPDYASFYNGRTAVGIAILQRFNDEKIEIAFPTQVNLTAAPDGSMVMPFPEVQQSRADSPST
jgi:small-conductance mechanosensitive channel